jgi:hypothetical protein
MEFPTDIWREITDYFAPIYRQPPHHKAMMGVDVFRNRNQMNQYQDPRAKREMESFYMNIVVSSWWYWAFPDIQNLMMAPEVVIRRGGAVGNTRDEFIDIYDEYSKSHALNHIQYEI